MSNHHTSTSSVGAGASAATASATGAPTRTDRELAAGHTLGFASRRGASRIRVTQGRVWITQSGDPRDHILGAGECFVSDRPGRVVIQALTDSRLQLTVTRAGHRHHHLPPLDDHGCDQPDDRDRLRPAV